MKHSIEIDCSACGRETLLRREPVYEGFKKTGERLLCAGCGHLYAREEDVPFKDRSGPRIFSESDKSGTPRIFQGDEGKRTCRYCRHYVVNPFAQRCGLRRTFVEATDFCERFEKKPAAEDEDA